jgi:uncharacterized protein (TIGR02271 family)
MITSNVGVTKVARKSYRDEARNILNGSKTEGTSTVVVDKNGLEGIVVEAASSTDPEARWLVRFQNGKQVIVPSTLLKGHEDGRYRLMVSVEELLANQEQTDTWLHTSRGPSGDGGEGLSFVTPIIEEGVRIQTRTVETERVELHKTVHERTEVVDEPLHIEEVEIERVAINQIVEEPVAIRHEGDTTIIPLLEEVLVIEKRLVLREEIHIKKLHKEVHDPQEVLLREERVEVVRKSGSSQEIEQT